MNEFSSEVLILLLGDPPSDTNCRKVFEPLSWPEDYDGQIYFFRAVSNLLRDRGGTTEAATSIRRDLQSGALPSVVVAPDGREHQLDAKRWRGDGSRLMYWTGRAQVHMTGNWTTGDIYILDAQPTLVSGPAPAPAHLSPYIQFMLRLAHDLKITPQRQPKVDSLLADIKARWPAELGEYSNRLAHGIATLLREPGSRGKQKGSTHN